MALKVGDKVRTDTGEEGEVVLIYSDQVAAMVRMRGADPDATLTAVSLAGLTRIKAYTPPPASA